MQGVVDSSYKFIDINIGWPGKVHDARVFANSLLFKKGMSGVLFPASKRKKINNINIPLVPVADAAYPLRPWVMRPYQDAGNLSAERLHFNYRISHAWMVVENAFGRLKGRWRCLLKQNEAGMEKMNSVVATCCMLHNICEICSEEFDPELLEEDVSCIPSAACQELSLVGHVASQDANSIHDALVQYCQDADLQ